MKPFFRLLSIAFVLTTVFTFVSSVRPATAACAVASGSNPPSLFINVPVVASHTYILVVTGVTNETFPFRASPIGIDGIIPQGILWGDTITIIDTSIDCAAAAGPITYFNPNDGRLNGKPGDRLVVYCNAKAAPPNVEVFVVAPGGIGTSLGKLPLADLASGQISKNLGANGTLWAGTNADGVSYVALQGGKYNATGVGDWAKIFTCKA